MKKKTEEPKKNEDLKKLEDPKKTQEQKQEKEKEKGKEKEKDKIKQEEKKEKSKPKKKKPITKFNIDYIFRREQYILKNQKLTLTFKEMKKLISEELNIEESNIIINLDKEITSKTKVFDYMKENKITFFEVKKKASQVINESIKSYINTIKINHIKEAFDFNKQIDTFFSDLCLEKECISEPTSLESYNVSFSRSDLAFDFKKFLTILKKVNELYKDIEIEVDIPKNNIKTSLFDNNNNKKYKNFKIPSAEHFKKQLGDYFTWNDIKRIQNMEDREKWIDQKGFYNSAGPVKKK